MTLEEIVPPIDLCKKIPAGEFVESVFVWVVNGDYQPKFQIVDKRKYPFIPENGATIYPAPTLQEIIQNCGPAHSWTAKNNPSADKSIIEEALEAWLKYKKNRKGK